MAIGCGIFESKGQSVVLPEEIPEKKLDNLARDIVVYLKKTVPSPTFVRSSTACACALVDMMRTGIEADGVTMIPKVDWITRNAPSESQYPIITGSVGCRIMSSKTREIKQRLVTPSGHPHFKNQFHLSDDTM